MMAHEFEVLKVEDFCKMRRRIISHSCHALVFILYINIWVVSITKLVKYQDSFTALMYTWFVPTWFIY